MLQRQELRKAGLKVTLPRLKILEILETSTLRHLSAEDIYRQLLETGEDIGLATVYRVLTQFETAGLVTRHNFEGALYPGPWPGPPGHNSQPARRHL
jgi:Fur family ferric uptake transcriptional regulator